MTPKHEPFNRPRNRAYTAQAWIQETRALLRNGCALQSTIQRGGENSSLVALQLYSLFDPRKTSTISAAREQSHLPFNVLRLCGLTIGNLLQSARENLRQSKRTRFENVIHCSMRNFLHFCTVTPFKTSCEVGHDETSKFRDADTLKIRIIYRI